MAEWQTEPLIKCLGALIDYRGKSPPKSNTGIPVLSAKVVKTTGLLRPIAQKIARDFYPKWMTRGLPQPGDVVMTTEAPMGEVIQLDEESARFALGQRIVCMRGKSEKLDSTFLRYLLTSPVQQEILASYATGTTVLGISQKALRSMPISFPSHAEQEKIGQVLATLDDKIELNRRMNETLEAMARAIFKDWFVDFGPTHAKAEGRAPYHAPELWDLFPDALDDKGLPEGREEQPFVSFLEIVGGGTPKTKAAEYWGGGIPWFSVVDTPPKGGVFVRSTGKTISEKGLAESSARLIPAGTTIITARGTVGNIAMAARDMTFNQSCYALRAQTPVGDRFVYLAAERMVQRLQALAHGSVFSTITRATFESLTFPWPGEHLFEEFEELLEPIFSKINASGEENEILAATRDLLLPKLMSGEIRLAEPTDSVP